MGKFSWRTSFCVVFSVLLSLFIPEVVQATHVYGADLYYTYVGGTTYTVTMVVYGDCQAQPNIFNGLYSGRPQINVSDGPTIYTTITLDTVSPAGVEVTPVCPLDSLNTACTNQANPIPGVKKFVYRGTVTLPHHSANWSFNFNGSFGPGGGGGGGGGNPGRSATITNVAPAGTLALSATLNDTSAANSSPVYTTIPTPFFCMNKQANYNPGVVDANGDSLSFALVAPINPNGGIVPYVPPFTPTQPISVVPGSQIFNTTNGQFTFIPDITQRALVVYTVSEYRNGVLVGTSQREMTYVVLNNCNTDPPSGGITNASSPAINIIDSTDVTLCSTLGDYHFDVNPYSPTGNHITVTAAGLPAGSSYNITGNGTQTPSGTFFWTTTGIAPGKYKFFLTYVDDGCPLASKQTFTYNITVFGVPRSSVTQITPATCQAAAQIIIAPAGIVPPWTVLIKSGSIVVQSNYFVTGPFSDSLGPGTYTLEVSNSGQCPNDTFITIAPPTALAVSGVAVTDATCYRSADGKLAIGVSGGTAPYLYEVNNLGFGGSDSAKNLDTGAYFVHIQDINGCTASGGPYKVHEPTQILVNPVITNSICHTLANGALSVTATGGSPGYNYSVDGGAYTASNSFSSLAGGNYILHVRDTHSCVRDTPVTVLDLVHVSGQYVVTQPLCYGQAAGAVTVTGISGTSPYVYAFGAGAYSSITTYSNLASGTYPVHIKDSIGCVQDTQVIISQPTLAVPHAAITPPVCFGGADGSLTISGSGGTPGYLFSFNGGAVGSKTNYTGLTAGIDSLGIQDANGCMNTVAITVVQPPRILIDSAIPINVLCHGDNTGLIIASGTNGASPYSYSINGGPYQLGKLITGLGAGTYVLRVKDNNGCTRDTTLTINQPLPLVNSPDSIVNPTCEGFTDGFIRLSTTGGTPIYAYSLADSNHFSNNPLFGHLGEGTYLFYVRDSHNCTYDTTITLTGYPHILIDHVATTNIGCNGGTEGSIILSTEGGVEPLSYQLDAFPSSPSDTFNHLGAGTYTIIITDSKNCTKQTTVTITQPDALSIVLNVTPNECNGDDANGKVDAVVSGGTTPYNYTWTLVTGANDNFIERLKNGPYSVLITDANKCTDSAFAVVAYDNCCKPWLPNAFTPNGDGKDDLFRLHYKGDLKLEAFWVYDRFGKRVFIANDINQGWDGTYNGVSQNMDTYFYYVKGICGNRADHEVVLKGDVTLVR